MEYERQREGPAYQRYELLPGAGRAPFLTWALLGANLTVWLVVSGAGADTTPEVYLDYGAMFGPFIANGEYWRLITATFLHIGFSHLAFNSLALFIFGRLVEKAFGHSRFLLIYVLAGLSGSVTSYVMNSIAIGAGASGAIFGLLGAMVAYSIAQRTIFGAVGRRDLTGVLFLAAIVFLHGYITEGVDSWAHFGGLTAGLGLGLALAPRYTVCISALGTPVAVPDTGSPAGRAWVVPTVLVVSALGTVLGTATLPDNAFSHVYRAEGYYEQREVELALAELDEALHPERTMAQGHLIRAAALAHLLRGRIYVDAGDARRATVELATAARWGSPTTRAEARELLAQLRSSF